MEVNASPSLSTTTEADRILKVSLLKDIYNIVAAGIPNQVSDNCKTLLGYAATNNIPGAAAVSSVANTASGVSLLGGFYLLFDEANDKEGVEKESGGMKGGYGEDDEDRGLVISVVLYVMRVDDC